MNRNQIGQIRLSVRSGRAVRPGGRRSEVAAKRRAREAAGGRGGRERQRSPRSGGRGRDRGARGGEVRGAAKPRPDPSRPDAEDGGGANLPR